MTDRDPHAHELEATGSRHPRGKTGATPAAGADDAQLPSGMLGCWIFLAVRIFSITAQFVGVAVLLRARVVDHSPHIVGGQVLVDVPLSPHKRRKSGHFLTD